MLTELFFFVAVGATLSLLLWSGTEIFRTQEDPLGDRLEELQSQALVVAQRTARRKIGGTGLDRILSFVGDGSGRRGLDARLGTIVAPGRRPETSMRWRSYTLGTILWTLLLLTGCSG